MTCFEFLGLTVGLIQSDMEEGERKLQYAKDIVYVTNAELGFDYLRDNLSYSSSGIVLPDNWRERFCLVDEADSIFIDEARTPLIISKSVDADGAKVRNREWERLKRECESEFVDSFNIF